MEKSFGNLLRHSRLASYDRTLPQVYKTTQQYKRIGEYGLKRNLPTVIKTPHLTIGALDTAEHQTPWESGSSKVLFLKRWKENFPNSKKPAPQPIEEQYNIASMTPAEFQRFLGHSSTKANAFQEALKSKQLVADQVFDYLHITTQEEGGSVVGPTYSDHQVGWDYPVQGRILNADRQGLVVGIGGIVATLPKRSAIGLRNSGDRKVRTFYVRQAELDSQGKPKVEVTVQPKGATSSIPLLNNFESYDAFDEDSSRVSYQRRSNRTTTSSSSTQNQSIQQAESEDNITPNPEHTELMARIADLLDSSKERK